MRRLGRAASSDADCLLTGGATAVLVGWRESTIDVDLWIVPELDEVLRTFPVLKEELEVNIELVHPSDFVPIPHGSDARAVYVGREGRLTFRHVDLYSQALAKLERGHARDLEDVAAMGALGLIEAEQLARFFDEIEPDLYRYPAVDPRAFRSSVEQAVRRLRDR